MEHLQPWQLTNHFMKNVAITTKVGRRDRLSNRSWHDEVECDDIFPALLRPQLAIRNASSLGRLSQPCGSGSIPKEVTSASNGESSKLMVNSAVLDVAMRVARKHRVPGD